MQIDAQQLDNQLLSIFRKRYGDLMAENLRLEAIQSILVKHIESLEQEVASLRKEDKKPSKKSNDGGSF